MKLQLGSQGIAIFMAIAVFLYMGISVSKNVIPDEIKGCVTHNWFPCTLFVPHEALLNQKNLKLIQWWTWQFIIIRSVFSAVIIYCRNWNWPGMSSFTTETGLMLCCSISAINTAWTTDFQQQHRLSF